MDSQPETKRQKLENNGESNGSGYAINSGKGDDNISLPTSITFTTDLDGLQPSLKVFKDAGAKISQLESRPSKTDPSKHDFLVGLDEATNIEDVCKTILDNLKPAVSKAEKLGGESIPWFPRHISDLDKFADRVLSYGDELDSDHPGFTDPVYRKRRKEFADIAIKHRHGEMIPNVEYTEEEIKTWGTIFSKLTGLYPTHACSEMNEVFPELVAECDYRVDTIPQLEKVSNFLKKKTGFSLRPVAGLLSSRDFLNGLAFRVFHSTQYIRHSSVPMYTPEPDVCHELIGHVPLFSNPGFARFSQEIGMLSLGISDEWVTKLATLYWFTVEFGLCRQRGQVKAYGAGLLSSFGELQYSIESDKCERRDFNPEKTCVQEYPITSYQPIYFVADSFDGAKEKLKSWAEQVPRPFSTHYNPYTQTVEVIENKEQVASIVGELKSQVDSLQSVLKSMN